MKVTRLEESDWIRRKWLDYKKVTGLDEIYCICLIY